MTLAIDHRLLLSDPIVIGGLAVYAVLDQQAPDRPEGDFLSLEEGLKAETLHVEELNEGGSVPYLRVKNEGGEDVLLLAGEVVTGGKQDRVIIEDVVVAAGTEQSVKVNCVEHGRWSRGRGSHFGYGGKAESSLVRKLARKSQRETWDEVARLNAQQGTDNATGTYRASLEKEDHGEVTEKLEQQLASLDKVVGVVLSLDGELQGAELFDHPRLFEKSRRHLLDSFVREAAGLKVLDKPVRAPSIEDTATWVRAARDEAREVETARSAASEETRYEAEHTQTFTTRSKGRALRTRILKKD